MKTTKYSIRHREEGRGRWATTRFSTLAAASQYIQDRWQGAEYMDGSDGFHTDYCEYELRGFTLADIGTIGWHDDAYRTFAFRNLETNPDGKARIVAVEGGPENECYHFRATEAYIQQEEAKGRLVGVWTDAQYVKEFGKPLAQDENYVAETMEEMHAKHTNPGVEFHAWCPLCQAAYREIHKNDPAEQIPF